MADILHKDTYNIHLPVFDGPFDLLLFFIERDELDIQNIPIAKITGDFLDYIRSMEEINIDLAGEFIVTAATLMRIKARMLLPLKKNEETQELEDPRDELVNKILIFKSFKEVSEELSRLETERAMLHTRGGILSDIKRIQHASVSYNELESANLYNLIRTFNRLLARMNDPDKSNVHQIVDYPYTIQDCREDILNAVRNNEKCSFDTLFSGCENRIHAIVQFLSLLELINQQLVKIVNASGANAFWISEKKTEERDSSDEAN
ncbi:MAG TPA: segregation/condensation protein A [Saprospiraceae bacterium]|jgi:segregation and condensation protein A|nr:MAG: segregation and condensation protein A [Candidatus Parvibacillus calidus]WKZ63492.1 MAG: segregation/condensation protein A [Saprospiraceae bacterium]HQN56726.1 segregation/condensation protein A [Saprospiraceae bacterium]HQP76878.1 segregation/condensation protein A [Saprospiraceae bacterium]